MKPTPTANAIPARTVLERRSFLWKAGAALSGTLASAAAIAASPVVAAPASPIAPLGPRPDAERSGGADPAVLESAAAICGLREALAHALNERRFEDVVGLFTERAEVRFNGGIFSGASGVRRLYAGHFGGDLDGERGEPVHRFMLGDPGPRDTLDIAPDRRSATGRFHCNVLAEAAIAADSSLAAMARQQGQGTVRWWEDGVFDCNYVKTGGAWKLDRLAYRADPSSNPALARYGAAPRGVPRYSSLYPGNPSGPDRLEAPPAPGGTEA